jgi:hypothetical protein
VENGDVAAEEEFRRLGHEVIVRRRLSRRA